MTTLPSPFHLAAISEVKSALAKDWCYPAIFIGVAYRIVRLSAVTAPLVMVSDPARLVEPVTLE